ncbi:hypothetical protein BGZ49_001703 [Haplosporangium sp. Z 27]|nr:hypothetical protein BGZ49_001703 [Haplosporangium sp. Z 27]
MALGPRVPAKPLPVIIDDEKEYEAESILDDRLKDNRREYLIKWKDWPLEDSSWKAESNLEHCQGLLQEFKQEEKMTEPKRFLFLAIDKVANLTLQGVKLHSHRAYVLLKTGVLSLQF